MAEEKEVLFDKVPSQKQRRLARCIEHYRDETEVERLEKWLNISDDMLAPTALMALSRIDPQRALRGLAEMKPFDLYACRDWWLNQLTARCPGEPQAALRGLLLSNSENKWLLARIYQGAMHLMDKETLRVLLNDLDALMSARLANPQDSSVNLIPALTLLEDVTSPHLLPIFEGYAGMELEKHLLELAKSWLERANLYKDHELEKDGYQTLICLSVTNRCGYIGCVDAGFLQGVNDLKT
jgi:hypothetical protein